MSGKAGERFGDQVEMVREVVVYGNSKNQRLDLGNKMGFVGEGQELLKRLFAHLDFDVGEVQCEEAVFTLLPEEGASRSDCDDRRVIDVDHYDLEKLMWEVEDTKRLGDCLLRLSEHALKHRSENHGDDKQVEQKALPEVSNSERKDLDELTIYHREGSEERVQGKDVGVSASEHRNTPIGA